MRENRQQMKRMMIVTGVAAALAVAWPAFAQSGSQGRRATERPQPAPPPSRPADLRDQGREPPRRATMTPDERRDLRRDIRDHGREVYGDPKSGPQKR
jgi:hypothetical protein